MPATGNAQSLTVESHVHRITRCEVTMTGDSNDWSQRHAGCSRTDTVAWRQPVQTSVDEHRQLGINALTKLQPVNIAEHRLCSNSKRETKI